MKIRSGGAWRSITSGKVRVSGQWRDLVNGKEYVGGAWVNIFNFTLPDDTEPPDTGGGVVNVSVSPTSLRQDQNTNTQTTATVTATPSGGKAPYTYSWVIVAQNGSATFSITAPTKATTAVKADNLPEGTTSCTIRCTVTDSLGTVGTSSDVVATFKYTRLGSGGGDYPDTQEP